MAQKEELGIECPPIDASEVEWSELARTGRSEAGRLRNFGAMSGEKFARVYLAVSREQNDSEAMAALDRELSRRAGAAK